MSVFVCLPSKVSKHGHYFIIIIKKYRGKGMRDLKTKTMGIKDAPGKKKGHLEELGAYEVATCMFM